ncbi:hypothetical protein Acr_14g0000290 [Actinidia rufa]|uniref:Uncharacterized protein n=1 Tax=Actinidia rufa TaxID=165716 RepID=A0A7J0FNU6_9ERIC|nr:hypothetical protein Acr_14g0000290 [Actinidia rufa]
MRDNEPSRRQSRPIGVAGAKTDDGIARRSQTEIDEACRGPDPDCQSSSGFIGPRLRSPDYEEQSPELRALKALALDKDHETATTFNMLKEVEAVTLVVLESLLSYTAGTKVQARGSGWSLVSKMMHHKSAAAVHAKEIVTSEFEKVDTTGQALISHKPSKYDDNKNIENVQNQIRELE